MKHRRVVITTALMLMMGITANAVLAQVSRGVPELTTPRTPRVSQGAEVQQIVGLSKITITYHRPGVKGRVIWGGLLPYDEVWRAGANEPTLVTFSNPVTIGGNKLPSGTYRFLVIPRKGDWTVIFNSETKNWGTQYDSTYDVLKLQVKPAAGQHEEWMSFSFTDLSSTSATIVLAWEKVRLGFTVMFDTPGMLESSVGDWRALNSAARFALTEPSYKTQATKWIDRSIALDRNQANVRTKAELLAADGKYKEAITLAEEAIKLSKQRNPNANVSSIERLIESWKKM